MRRFPPRPWAPLTTHELHALLPHLLPRTPKGRRVHDLRTRLDGLFWIASFPYPWRALPSRFGKPDTISRWFRRLTASGLWEQLLHTLADRPDTDPLHSVGIFILRACRRADCQVGHGFQRLIRRLGLTQALPGPPWLLPDPILSESLRHLLGRSIAQALDGTATPWLRPLIRLLKLHHRSGRPNRRLRLAWS